MLHSIVNWLLSPYSSRFCRAFIGYQQTKQMKYNDLCQIYGKNPLWSWEDKRIWRHMTWNAYVFLAMKAGNKHFFIFVWLGLVYSVVIRCTLIFNVIYFDEQIENNSSSCNNKKYPENIHFVIIIKHAIIKNIRKIIHFLIIIKQSSIHVFYCFKWINII